MNNLESRIAEMIREHGLPAVLMAVSTACIQASGEELILRHRALADTWEKNARRVQDTVFLVTRF